MSEMRELLATDDTFREVADLLFGGGTDDLISKMNPTQSDLSAGAAKKKREQTQARIGLATNVIGIGAGAAATPPAFKAVKASYKDFKSKEAPYKPKHAVKVGPQHKGGALVKLGEMKGGKKAALGLAGGAAGLQVANLAGDAIANRVLSRASKKDPNVKGGTLTAVRSAETQTKKLKEIGKRSTGVLKPVEIAKNDEIDVTWEAEITKADGDKQQVFGWASVVEVNGEPVVDLQGDRISVDEMEKAGYQYVMKSRSGGDMHLRDDWQAIKKSEMIESFIVTEEKREAMGLPDSVPTGWWVGFQVQDPDVWAKVKSGERTGFSIHGRGKRSDG